MQRIVENSVSDVDADILILGSLTVFSACIPKVYGMYDGREVFANLFLFVTARASAGKGRLSLCRHLAAPMHKAFLAALPDTFDRPTYLKTAASLNIIERTAERYISDLCKSGLLAHPANGQYQKNPEGVPRH